MTDWLGYALDDFLMFGPEVYWRLFALHNRALWPLPAAAIALGVAILFFQAAPERPRRLFIGFAAASSWAGAAHFLATRYAPINWPLEYAIWLFGAETAMIVAWAVSGALAAPHPETGLARRIGLGLLAYSVLLHPLVGLCFGRPLAQAEVLGLAPDPTALASLGLLLLIGRSRWRAALSIVPVAWCVVSAATLLALGEPQGWILVAALGLWSIGRVSEATSDRRRDEPASGRD